MVLVYVGDLLVLGTPEALKAMISGVSQRGEVFGNRALEEGRWNLAHDTGQLHQGSPQTKPWRRNIFLARQEIPLAKEPEVVDNPEEKTAANVKEAQKVVGELVLDHCKNTSKSSFCCLQVGVITKSPLQVVSLVKSVWHYLAATFSHGFVFKNEEGKRQLNVFTDASYSDVSFGCHLVLWGSSLLLWKAGKQPVQAASTAEWELVEVLEGSLAGDAVKVVLEEALDVVARSFSCTDSSAAVSIIAGESGSWGTRHLRKRAYILRSKVLSGEWLLRHVPGADMSADLGTKVLSVQKFNQHKEAMGMFVGMLEVEEENHKEGSHQAGISQKAKENALKAIILMTKLALAKGEEVSTALIVRDSQPILPSASDRKSFAPLIVFAAVIFCIGVLVGICIMGILLWKQVDRVTLVNYKGSFVNAPVFFWVCFERSRAESTRSNDDATFARRRSVSSTAEASFAPSALHAANSGDSTDCWFYLERSACCWLGHCWCYLERSACGWLR